VWRLLHEKLLVVVVVVVVVVLWHHNGNIDKFLLQSITYIIPYNLV
jgi:hypothetical protein